MKNWTAFKGDTLVEFSSGAKNVTLIRGRNQRGKTNFLRAIKWVLYEDTGDTLEEYNSSLKLLNREAMKEGNFSASVKLTVEKDQSTIEINRSFQARKSAKDPKESDFEKSFIVLMDGKAVPSPDKFINSFLAKEISEFFLFNGEDLQKYKQLGTSSKRSSELKNAIERVIQTPFLITAQTEIKQIKKLNYDLLEAQTPEGDLKDIRARIKTLNNLEIDFDNQKEELGANLKTAESDKEKADAAYRLVEENYEIASDLRTEERSTDGLEKAKTDAENDIKDATEISWKILAKKIIESHENKQHSEEKNKNHFHDSMRASLLKKSIDDGTCALRLIKLDQKEINFYKNQYNDLKNEDFQLNDLDAITKKSALTGITHDFKDLINPVIKYQSAVANKIDNEIKIDNLKKKLGKSKSKEIIDAYDEKENANKRVEELKKAIAKLDVELEGPNAKEGGENYGKIGIKNTKLALEGVEKEMSPDAKSRERELDKIYQSLNEIFSESISDLSNQVKDVILEEGNKIYQQMLKDETKNKLKINSDYGLELVDQDGKKIPDSSAGNQIIVMALFYGLKVATGIEGPIVVDTPLARIDDFNDLEFLNVLPTTATQCILLPTGKEIPVGGPAEQVLLPKVGKSYEIDKKSDQHSEILEI